MKETRGRKRQEDTLAQSVLGKYTELWTYPGTKQRQDRMFSIQKIKREVNLSIKGRDKFLLRVFTGDNV